jgi:N-acetylglucosaminyl-diphospho-decaprenol L-rhamnosyltransferase
MLVHLLVLNYNGRRLLEQCLPSVVEAAAASRHRCRVAVIDNDSRDDSAAWLRRHFPQVQVIHRPNRGLSSFNDVVPGLEGPVAILLNNDIKLDRGCVDPLVQPLFDPLVEPPPDGRSPCFMTAPLCWRFDGKTYEGFKTAVGWRWGLVEATALFPGHESTSRQPGLTASAGAVLAVDRRKFAELGGFDPLFLPGRLEDLDLAFRAYLAGYHARYVPTAVAYHLGMATFSRVFGRSGCDRLALRNTLLFQWKNLRHPAHRLRQWTGLAVRLAFDVLRAAWVPASERWAFTRALLGAFARWRQWQAVYTENLSGDPSPPAPLPASGERGDGRRTGTRTAQSAGREREFFRRFHPRRLVEEAAMRQAPGRPAVRRPRGQSISSPAVDRAHEADSAIHDAAAAAPSSGADPLVEACR